MEVSVREIFKGLFTWPAEAVVDAEKQYRAIWLEYIVNLQARIPQGTTDEKRKEIIKQAFKMAPVMKFHATVEAEVTMRIESSSSTGVDAGLQVGPFVARGRYNSSTGQESTFRALANYEISNSGSCTLKEYVNPGIDVDANISKEDFLEKVKEQLQ